LLKKSFILCALLLAGAFSQTMLGSAFKVDFAPGGNPAEFIFDYDPATNTLSTSSLLGWISGGGEIFQFDLDASAPTPPGCAVGPTFDAQIFNCLIATTATDPSILFRWTVSPGAGFSSANQVADLLLTISDSSGTLFLDSGPTLGTGLCAPGFSAPCGYGGATFSGTFTVSPAPEPASAGLALAGLGLLLAASRWRARSSGVRE
jgi:hypothetical protein